MQKPGIIGIDEVGRGPLAGPVVVAAFWARDEKTLEDILQGAPISLKDSKKLTEKKRNIWYQYLQTFQEQHKIKVAITAVSATDIDDIGIVPAIRNALHKSLSGVASGTYQEKVFLDGGLFAPDLYVHQETIIKGDEKIPCISLASIVAKVTRDTKMNELGREYPEYKFEKHKGYGTKAHFKAIETYGILEGIHRKSFLKKVA